MRNGKILFAQKFIYVTLVLFGAKGRISSSIYVLYTNTKLNIYSKHFGFEILYIAVNGALQGRVAKNVWDDEHKRKMIIIIEKYVKAQIEHFQK